MRSIIQLLFPVYLLIGVNILFGQTTANAIIDTVEVEGRAAILFSGKKWAFLDEYQKSLVYDSLFTKNWITKDIHSYPSQKSTILEEKAINLLENVNNFVFPLDSFKQLRGFTGYHTGLDLKAPTGDTVRAAFDGRVRFASNIRNGYGNLVIIRHYNGLETYYSHLSKILVSIDDDVKSGCAVGLVGSTGRASGPHLHFETRYRDIPFDPLKFINTEQKCLISDSLLICNSLLGKSSGKAIVSDTHGDSDEYHTIIRGDTLYKIAKKYNTTVEAICQLNSISKTTILRIGQKLIIP